MKTILILLTILLSFELYAESATTVPAVESSTSVEPAPGPATTVPGEPTPEEIAAAEAEAARLAEAARRQDIRDRLKALKHRRDSMRRVLQVSNAAAWLRDNIGSMDHAEMEAKILAIEVEDFQVETDIQAQKTRDDAVQAAKVRMKSADCAGIANAAVKDMCLIFKRR